MVAHLDRRIEELILYTDCEIKM